MATDIEPRSDTLLALGLHGFHGVHYLDWGRIDNPHIVVCAHGLTRNAHDFDYFARALAPDLRLVCPDMPGRGQSDWLDHKEDYGYPTYANDCATLMARVSAHVGDPGASSPKVIDWVGTSMGGIIGLTLAAQPRSPIRRLVINDVGAILPKAALERIADYVGRNFRFASLDELERHLRVIAAPFGPLTDAQWRHLAGHGAKQHEDGMWTFSYDPGIAVPLQTAWDRDIDLWPLWDAIRCPTLILRGADSDLLLPEIAREMLTRGPKARLVEFPGIGHAPTLMSDDQIKVVRDFLLKA